MVGVPVLPLLMVRVTNSRTRWEVAQEGKGFAMTDGCARNNVLHLSAAGCSR